MKITEPKKDNIDAVINKITGEAYGGKYGGVVNTVINTTIEVYNKIKDKYKNKEKTRTVKTIIKNELALPKIVETKRPRKNNNGRCVIFASFSSDGKIKDSVKYYLNSLSDVCDYVVFVTDNDIASEDEYEKISELTDCVITGRHGGYDFGSWRRGINYLRKTGMYGNFKQLVLANDSCYGPVFPLKTVFDEMGQKKYDFWGILNSTDIRYHILSFFIVFNNNVYTDALFISFFGDMPKQMSRDEAVGLCELRITNVLSEKFVPGAYAPDFYDNYRSIVAGNKNSTLWPISCLNANIPLIKKKALDGGFGIELHEGSSDALYTLKQKNKPLYDIIYKELVEQHIDENIIKFDSMSSDISELIIDKDVVSFDVFDTLLIRPFMSPADLFRYLSIKYDEEQFAIARITAENEARKRQQSLEVTLDEIYDEMPTDLKYMKEYELESEMNVIHKNPTGYKMYLDAVRGKKRIVCISDTYLKASFVKNLLETNGYDGIENVFVSCEHRCNKGSKTLFEIMMKNVNTTPSKIIHFGDNEISDGNIPRSLGIDSYLIKRTNSYILEWHSCAQFQCHYQTNNTIYSSIHLALCSEYRKNGTPDRTFWNDIGYCIGGPLVLSYLKFVCDCAVENECDRLFFVSRDGYVLKKIYDEYFRDSIKIPSSYVHLSRHTGIVSLPNYYDCPPYIRTLLQYYKKKIHTIKVHDAYADNIKEYNAHKLQIEEMASDLRNNLTEHLISEAGSSEKIAVVDMVGSICTSLRTAKSVMTDKKLIGIYFGGFKTNNDIEYYTFMKRLLTPNDVKMMDLSECIITSPEKPILSLKSDGTPEYGTENDIDKKIKVEGAIDGIKEYCDDYTRYFGIDGPMMPAEEWISLAQHYLNYYSPVEIEYLKSMPHSPQPNGSDDTTNIK